MDRPSTAPEGRLLVLGVEWDTPVEGAPRTLAVGEGAPHSLQGVAVEVVRPLGRLEGGRLDLPVWTFRCKKDLNPIQHT